MLPDVITKKTIAYWQKIDAYDFIFLLNALSDSSLRGTVIFVLIVRVT